MFEYIKMLLTKKSISTLSLYIFSVMYIGIGLYENSILLNGGILLIVFNTILILLHIKDKTIKNKLDIRFSSLHFFVISVLWFIFALLLKSSTLIAICVIFITISIIAIFSNIITSFAEGKLNELH